MNTGTREGSAEKVPGESVPGISGKEMLQGRPKIVGIKLHLSTEEDSDGLSCGEYQEEKENESALVLNAENDGVLADTARAESKSRRRRCSGARARSSEGAETGSGHESGRRESLRTLRAESRAKVRWSVAELETLVQGVEKYGLSNWKSILEYGKDVFNEKRRAVDLIDKYRQYTKSTSFYTTEKRNWVELVLGDDDAAGGGRLRQTEMGDVVVVKEKFPYDAAVRFARKALASKEQQQAGDEFFVKIQDLDNPESVHLYSVVLYGGGAMKVRKVRSSSR